MNLPILFPANPTVGQHFGGYMWDGVKWTWSGTPGEGLQFVTTDGVTIFGDGTPADPLYVGPLNYLKTVLVDNATIMGDGATSPLRMNPGLLAAYLPITGGTMLGPLTLAADPTANMQAVTKQYVDNQIAAGGGPAISDVVPVPAHTGQLWWDTVGAQLYLYDGAQWVVTINQPMAVFGDVVPTAATVGQLWIQDDQVSIYEEGAWVPFVQMTRWTVRKAPPEVNDVGLNGVGYGNGLFVAVSTSGSHRVSTSPDAINWTAQIAVAQAPWTSVVYGNGIWVATASGTGVNQVMTSPDGINWTVQTAAANIGWLRVRFLNGLFIAISTGGVATQRVMTSPDGINWTLQTNPAGFWNDVAYGNGVFVAIGSAGVMTSPDAVTWTQVSGAAGARGIAFGNGIFVMCGNSLQTSPDGINWGNVQTLPYGFYTNQWSSIAYGAGTFVVMSSSNGNATFQRVALTRDSGVTWKLRLAPIDVWFTDVCYANGLWVAVTNGGSGMYIMTSPSP